MKNWPLQKCILSLCKILPFLRSKASTFKDHIFKLNINLAENINSNYEPEEYSLKVACFVVLR